jgi:uncharacterized protein (DUF1810 family)
MVLIDFVLEYAIKKLAENSGRLQFNSLHQELECTEDVNMLQ